MFFLLLLFFLQRDMNNTVFLVVLTDPCEREWFDNIGVCIVKKRKGKTFPGFGTSLSCKQFSHYAFFLLFFWENGLV